MAVFDVWDVVKVLFPYTNRPIQKRRPALIVARQTAKGMPLLLWVVMVTSAAHRRWPGDVDVSDLGKSGLPTPSMIRPSKIATIEALIAEPLGCLPTADRPAVADFLAKTIQDAVG